VNLRPAIISFYLLLFLSLAAGAGVFFLQTRREYNQLLLAEAQSRRQLVEAQQKLHEQERILDRLRNDPAFVEMAIRRRLGYAKPNEMIFRFESSDEIPWRHDEGTRPERRAP
jgi:cell division protein DivIC